MEEKKPIIQYDDFAKIDLRVGKIISAEAIEGSEKLVKLSVDIGGDSPRQILAGIKKFYPLETLVGRLIVVVANLEPRTFTLRQDSGQVGFESQGMLLAASSGKDVVLLTPEKETTPGAGIR